VVSEVEKTARISKITRLQFPWEDTNTMVQLSVLQTPAESGIREVPEKSSWTTWFNTIGSS